MKLHQTNPINLIKNNSQNVSFSGYQDDYNAKGEEGFKFFAPPYDKSRYNLSFEYVGLIKSGNEWIINSNHEKQGIKTVPMESDKPAFVQKEFPLIAVTDNRNKKNGSDPDRAFGYRFKLTEKENASNVLYLNDTGSLSKNENNGGSFNVLLLSTGGVHKKGPMYHVFADSYYNKNWGANPHNVLDVRNHFNIAGGNIEGMIDKIKNSNDLDAYGLIISNPFFGKDDTSSHGYWTTNPYQISTLAGNLDLFKQLNVELFKKGKQYVADGAFTSQGYQSPFLQHALKWGKQSPYFNWFKFDFAGNDSNPKITLGVLPESKKALENVSYKIVNAPSQDGYNSKKPTYIQFYDKRLTSKEQAANTNELIKTYDGKLKDNYDISNHQDGLLPYSFEIDPGQTGKIRVLVENAGKPVQTIKNYEDLLTFENFKITQKRKSSGANFWDGQLDLVKMNLANPNVTDENKIACIQAKNYLFNAATYWTRSINSALLDELITNPGSAKEIAKRNGVSENEFNQISSAIKSGDYQVNLFKDQLPKEKFILNEIMDFPLESIEVSPDLTAVLGSPLITPNATSISQSNAKKVDLLQDSIINPRMKKVYSDNIAAFVTKVLEKMDTSTAADKKIFINGELSEYGRFVTRMIAPELTKYAIVKGMFGENDIEFKENGIRFKTNSLSKKGIHEIGISSDAQEGPKGEAKKLSEKIYFNTLNLSQSVDKFAQIYNKKFAKTDLNSFKLAQAVIEKSGAGLNWRFDAAKDVADLSRTRSSERTYPFKYAMDDMISFWTPFIANIKKENPNSLSIAELTSLSEFYKGDGDVASRRPLNAENFGKYTDFEIAEKMFYEKTGATTGSNYTQFFGIYPELYGQNIEHGTSQDTKISWLYGKFFEFANAGNLPFIINNHIFVDNHDKPRALHGMALDMNLFLHDTPGEGDCTNYENRARSIMGNDINLRQINSKGVAVAEVYKEHFRKFAKEFNLNIEKIDKAIISLAAGKISVDNSEYNEARSRAFGVRPFEITIKDIIKRANLGLNQATEAKLEQKVLESIMELPLQKFSNMWEIMATTIGVATMFNGEEYGQTGHETKNKNQELGCRNIVLHNRKNDGSKFSEFYKRVNAASDLHNKTGLSALSGGFPIVLQQDDNENVTAIYKYDSKGSEVLTVISDIGVDRNDLKKPVANVITNVDKIRFDKENGEHLPLKGGLEKGTEFKRKIYDEKTGSYRDDNIVYVVSADGKSLVRKDNKQIALTSGANIFYRVSGAISFKGNPNITLHNIKYAIPNYN